MISLEPVEITIPQYTKEGIWTLDYIQAEDITGNHTYIYTDELNELGVDTEFEVINSLYGQDTESPLIHSLEISQNQFDITNGEQSFILNASFYDDISGEVSFGLGWDSPNNNHSIGVYYSPEVFEFQSPHDAELTINGNYTNYEIEVTIPQFSEGGTWNLNNIYFADKAGNRTSLYGSDQILSIYEYQQDRTPGINLDFEVINNNAVDITPPSLRTLEISENEFDLSSGDQSFTLNGSYFDNLGDFHGSSHFDLTWTSPSGNQSIHRWINIYEEYEINILGDEYEYDINNNVLNFENVEVTIPQYSEPGTWTLSGISLTDGIGNRNHIYREEELDVLINNLGIDVEFEVINSDPDSAPPELKSLVVDDYFDLSQGDVTSDVTLNLIDDKSGIQNTYTSFAWSNEDGERIYWNTKNNNGPKLNGSEYSFPNVNPGDSILISNSELTEVFTDPEGDLILVSSFWTDYGNHEVIEEGKIKIPIDEDIYITAELHDISDNDIIYKLYFPENIPIGSFDLNYHVMDTQLSFGSKFASASTTVNIVPEGYINPIDEGYVNPINKGPNNTKLFKDVNSGELLFADSSNESEKILLINKDSSSFVSDTNQIAVDIEQSDDGSIKLLFCRSSSEH